METHTGVWLLTVGLLAALNSALAEDRYVVVGGNIELGPPVPGPITNILWKHNGNLLAEWAKDEVELTYFFPFEGHTTLDITSGRLEVRNMTIAHTGLYTVEINNKVQDQRYDVKVIEEVPKPSIWIRPLTCSSASTNCTLTCNGETEKAYEKAEPVTYSWKRDEEEWKQSTKDMTIIKTEMAYVKTFTCQMKNPVSKKDSEPKDNPLFEEKEAEDLPVGSVVFIIILVFLLIFFIMAVVGYFKRDFFKGLINRRGGENVTPVGNGNPSPDSPGPGTDGGKTENVPLNKPVEDA